MGALDGKVAIVTGGAAGIGRAAAIALAREGAAVAVGDVDHEHAADTAAAIRAEGGAAIAVAVDVADAAAVAAYVEQTVREFGGLDIAFNNAGIEGVPAPTADCSDANWERTIAVNLTGTWLCMREQIPHMLTRGGGSIINCSSVAGLVGFAAIPAYTASKHGVVGLTKSAALDYATQGIRVNAICPGTIESPSLDHRIATQAKEQGKTVETIRQAFVDRQPMGRLGKPEEIAALAVYLAGDESAYTTGQIFLSDGGFAL